MKKRTVILPTFLLSVALLSACGNNSQATTSTYSTVKSEITIDASTDTASNDTTEVKTISEALSNDKIICYMVSEMDKSETPDEIYFFDSGKLTVIPGEEFGKTLGEFSKMDEAEIWTQYEEVRTTYVDNYLHLQEEAVQNKIKVWEGTASALEDMFGADDVKASPDKYSMNDATYTEILEYLERLNNVTYKEPFYDSPVTFVVKTDATGNYTQTERVVYLTLSCSTDRAKETGQLNELYRVSIEFDATVEGADIQIYDTMYNCMPLTDGKILCTRALLTLDGVTSKNVLIDPTDEELSALYEDIVTKYE